MDAYEDELFETPITVDSVLFTPAPFYVRVWLHEDSNFAVQIERCWATAAQAADSSPSFEFIADGCGVNEVYNIPYIVSFLRLYYCFFRYFITVFRK